TNQSYAAALGCFGLALRFLRGGGWWPGTTSAVLMAIGAWTNAGVALFMLCLGVSRAALEALRGSRGGRAGIWRTRAVPLAAGAAVSIGIHLLLQQLAPVRSTRAAFAGLAAVPEQLAVFAGDTLAMGLPWLWPGLAL